MQIIESRIHHGLLPEIWVADITHYRDPLPLLARLPRWALVCLGGGGPLDRERATRPGSRPRRRVHRLLVVNEMRPADYRLDILRSRFSQVNL